MTPTCPDIADKWRGGRSETARILGIDPKTLDKYVRFGRIRCESNQDGRKWFFGREIKRFWNEY